MLLNSLANFSEATSRRASRLLVVAAIGIASVGAHAQDYGLCGPPLSLPAAPDIEIESIVPGAVDIESDSMDRIIETEETVFKGNVNVARDNQRMSADELRLTPSNDRVLAVGNVKLWQDGMFVGAERAELAAGEDTAELAGVRYRFVDAHAHGNADSVSLSGQEILRARDATYSTCAPGSEDWVLRASRIKLDREANRGVARNVTIDFEGVPIFYSPWLSFPLSKERKSGFLMPSAGASDSTGIEATVPYYFNIAPHLDATVALRGMSDRGVQLQGEFRYLFEWGSGEIAGELLPRDSKRDDALRAGVSIDHRGWLNKRLHANVNIDWVSDKSYFEELGTNLDIASRSYLEQRADIAYIGEYFNISTRVQDYITLDRTIAAQNRPYKRLPQVAFNTKFKRRNRALNFSLRGEVTNFEREDSVRGLRSTLEPSVDFPIRTAGYFFTPKAKLKFTQYTLNGVEDSDNNPSRLLPILSFDSGMFFDRQLSLGSSNFTQTLEPRLFYLYVPHEGQDELPLFDTGEYTFSFAQLFRDNRFSGGDRQADANQVTVALTSRLLDPTSGNEVIRASIGHIRYFRNRRVGLSGESLDTRGGSNVVAEVAANVDRHWRVRAGLQWEPEDNEAERATFGVRYRPDQRRTVNASYRFIEDEVNRVDLSAAWPIDHRWRAVGRFEYSFDNARVLETFGGFEYESCCWGVRAVARRYLTDTEGNYNNAFFVQLELKGLAGVGGARAFLERSIPGYTGTF